MVDLRDVFCVRFVIEIFFTEPIHDKLSNINFYYYPSILFWSTWKQEPKTQRAKNSDKNNKWMKGAAQRTAQMANRYEQQMKGCGR